MMDIKYRSEQITQDDLVCSAAPVTRRPRANLGLLCMSSTERTVLTPMIAPRRIPQKEEAMFYVASSRPDATFCEEDNQTSATPEGSQDLLNKCQTFPRF